MKIIYSLFLTFVLTSQVHAALIEVVNEDFRRTLSVLTKADSKENFFSNFRVRAINGVIEQDFPIENISKIEKVYLPKDIGSKSDAIPVYFNTCEKVEGPLSNSNLTIMLGSDYFINTYQVEVKRPIAYLPFNDDKLIGKNKITLKIRDICLINPNQKVDSTVVPPLYFKTTLLADGEKITSGTYSYSHGEYISYEEDKH